MKRGLPVKYYERFRTNVGIAGIAASPVEVARQFKVTTDFVRYHSAKVLDPDLHRGSWGGARHRLFPDDNDEQMAQIALWCELRDNPLRVRHQLKTAVVDNWNIPITDGWIRRVLREWRYTHKKASYRVIEKYSIENISYYW